MEKRRRFDFAVSFAGEDRATAERLAQLLREGGAAVFYDRFYRSELLGKRLAKEFRLVYGPHTEFFVPLVSRHYVAKPWPRREFARAKAEERNRKSEFILPLRIDDSLLPGLASDTCYADLRSDALRAVADTLLAKLARLAAPPEAPPEDWVATFGLTVEELLDNWTLPRDAPEYYPLLCDWLEADLEGRLRSANIDGLSLVEDARDGECLSVRVQFKLPQGHVSLDFGNLDWWELLEVAPYLDMYPE